MKYVVISNRKTDEFVDEFENRYEAINEAKDKWYRMTAHDKKDCDEFYVLESMNPDEDAEDHYDGNVIYAIKTGKPYEVEYSGGESRENPEQAVDYMMVRIKGTELYAELPAAEEENGNYEDLKDMIIDQADSIGYHKDMLRFWYD